MELGDYIQKMRKEERRQEEKEQQFNQLSPEAQKVISRIGSARDEITDYDNVKSILAKLKSDKSLADSVASYLDEKLADIIIEMEEQLKMYEGG